MNYSEHSFTDAAGQEIYYYKWEANGKPKAILQFAHGMQEHALRYSSFAETMASLGFTVYAHDHRGHGKTAGSVSNLGIIDPIKGWHWLVEDLYQLSTIIKKENPELPLYVTGHSMGSFVVRDFASKYGSSVNGIILSGTRNEPLWLIKGGLFFLKLMVKITGHQYKNAFLASFTMKIWNSKIKNIKTPFDWLNRDEEEVISFMEDKYCGFVCSNGFYRDLLSLLKNIYTPANIRKIPKNMPILFTAGDKDPVGNYGKGVVSAYKNFLKAGLKNVTLKLYKGGRHEILKETNRKEVINDLVAFISQSLPTTNFQNIAVDTSKSV